MSARGEQFIQAGDREIKILFTNRALAEAEQAMGKSIIGVAQGLVNGQAGIIEVAHLLRTGMQAARREDGERPFAVQMDKAYRLLDEVGFATVTTAVMEAVTAVLGYNPEEEEDDGFQDDDPDPNE